jgi:hypothetical protein
MTRSLLLRTNLRASDRGETPSMDDQQVRSLLVLLFGTGRVERAPRPAAHYSL